jgi:GAF domain-containing protein
VETLRFPSEPLQHLDTLFDLGREAPVEEAATRVVELALEAVPAASHTSLTFDAHRRGAPVCSDGVAKELDEAQHTSGSGPCLDSCRNGEIVISTDLSTEDRWPRFAEEARRRGVQASLSLPLTTGSGTIGSLNLYSDCPESFGPTDHEIALLIASRAAVGLANAELFLKATTVGEQLREALISRDVIGQAKGIIMATEGCCDEEAFRMLVTASQHSNRKLREIAKAILDEHAARTKKS